MSKSKREKGWLNPQVIAPTEGVLIAISSEKLGFAGDGYRIDMLPGMTTRSHEPDADESPRVLPFTDPVTGVKFHLRSAWDKDWQTNYGPEHKMIWRND